MSEQKPVSKDTLRKDILDSEEDSLRINAQSKRKSTLLISLLLQRRPPPRPQWRLFPLLFRDLRSTRNFMIRENGLYGLSLC